MYNQLVHSAGYVPQYAAGYVPQYAAGYDQIVGYEQIVGAGGGIIGDVGAALQAQAHGALPRQMHLAPSTIAYGANIGVEQRRASQPRLYPLNFTQLAVAASG